jgi:prepilin-type processing-associated H-X9-DG protein
MMYASDYDGHFPTQQIRGLTWADSHWTTGYFDGNWNCAWPNWISACIPYIKNTQIFNCPTAPLISDGSPYSLNGSSYSYVGWVAGHDRSTPYPAGGYIGWGRKQTEMNAPAEIIMVHDAIDKGQSQGYYARMYPAYQSTWNPPWWGADPTCDACVPPVHNGGFNSGFCDGHAKWLSQKDRISKKFYE